MTSSDIHDGFWSSRLHPVTPLAQDEQSDIREQLELAKLRLELRELSAPWWQKPSYMASIATIVAALLGVVWGMFSGFFDVARRELEVEKRELQAEIHEIKIAKDSKSQEFQRERGVQHARIQTLQNQESRLRNDVNRLDVPIIIEAAITRAPWDATQSESLIIQVGGVNLERVSEVRASLVVNCSMTEFGWASPEQTITATVVSAESNAAHIVLTRENLKNAYSAIVNTFAPAEQSVKSLEKCGVNTTIRLRRLDGKVSNIRNVPISDAGEWLLN